MNDSTSPEAPRVMRPRRPKLAESRNGRPADPTLASRKRADMTDDEGTILTRRSRTDGDGNPYELPNRLINDPDWHYEWKGLTVMGQDVPASDRIRVHESGWRPAKAEECPEMCPPGWKLPTIERDGMILQKRPRYLTEEARAEDLAIARLQAQNKLAAANLAPKVGDKMYSQVDKFEANGEIGTYEKTS